MAKCRIDFDLFDVIGLKTRLFFSLWTLTLCVVLLFLICFLMILIISVIRLRKRHTKQKHKKAHVDRVAVTPIHSDDDHNPDIIPQIEGTCYVFHLWK